jgi:hypothetical protein
MANVTLLNSDIEIRAQLALSTSPIFQLRDLRAERDEDGLVLKGRVSSFYFKQVAQELVRNAVPKISVINQIQVD